MLEQQKVAVLKALADTTRLALVRKLARCPTGKENCSELSATSGLSQPAMSHHFSKLAAAGVIIETKNGTHKSYAINRELLAGFGIDANKL